MAKLSAAIARRLYSGLKHLDGANGNVLERSSFVRHIAGAPILNSMLAAHIDHANTADDQSLERFSKTLNSVAYGANTVRGPYLQNELVKTSRNDADSYKVPTRDKYRSKALNGKIPYRRYVPSPSQFRANSKQSPLTQNQHFSQYQASFHGNNGLSTVSSVFAQDLVAQLARAVPPYNSKWTNSNGTNRNYHFETTFSPEIPQNYKEIQAMLQNYYVKATSPPEVPEDRFKKMPENNYYETSEPQYSQVYQTGRTQSTPFAIQGLAIHLFHAY